MSYIEVLVVDDGLDELGGELPEDELVGLHRPRSIDAEGFGGLSGIALYLSQSFARDSRDGLMMTPKGER